MIFLESITHHSHDKGRLCHALIGAEFMMGTPLCAAEVKKEERARDPTSDRQLCPTAAGLCLILLWWLLLSVPLSLLTRKLLN